MVSVTSFTIVFFLYVGLEYRNLRIEGAQMRTEYFNRQKAIIKEEVTKALRHIELERTIRYNELLEKDETETWIIKKIDALPTTQHTILYMRQVEKRSNTEIAQILGIGKDSVCALLSKARASLLSDFRQRIEAEKKRMSKL